MGINPIVPPSLGTPNPQDPYGLGQQVAGPWAALAGLAQGKGLKGQSKAGNTQESDVKDAHTQARTVYQTPDQYNEIRDMIANSPEVAAQQKDVDSMDNSLDMQKQLGSNLDTMNYSPLMALADAQTGSNLASSYKAPESGSQIIAGLNDFASKVAARRADLAKELTQGERYAKAGQDIDNYIQNMKNTQTQAADIGTQAPKTAAPPSTGNFLTWTGQVQKSLPPVQKMLNDTDQITKLLNSGLPAAQITARLGLIGLAGFHRFNTNEINAQVDPSIGARFEQLMQTAGQGNLTEENKQELLNTVKIMHDQILPTYNNYVAAQKANGINAGFENGKVASSLAPYIYKSSVPAAKIVPSGGTAAAPGQAAVGTQMTGRGGVTYVKSKAGPDNDKNNWQAK